jgi:drug/metabolite transporter (DMT)-like permease
MRDRHALRSAQPALLAAQVCFGLFPVFGKLAMQEVGPRALTALRIAVGALVLGLLALLRDPRAFAAARHEWKRLLACSLLGIVLNQVLFLEGVHRSSALHAGLIVCTIPVFTYLIAASFGQERWSARRTVGIGIALAGCAWLVLARGTRGASGTAPLTGDLLMVANCLLYSGYLVLSRPLLRSLSPLVLIAWAYALCVPWAPFLYTSAPPDYAALDGLGWASLAYVLVFPTVVAYLLISYALARVSASTAAIYNYLQPLVAGLGAWWLLGETPSAAAGVAAALLFAGIWLVTRDERGAAPTAGRSPRP